MTLSLRVKCDFPPKSLTISSSLNASVGELYQQLVKELVLPSIDDYHVYSVNYMRDIVDTRSQAATTKISSFLEEHASLIIRQKNQPSAPEPEEEDDDEEALPTLTDPYKGLTANNCWAKLASENNEEKKIAMEFIEMYGSLLFDQEGFLNLPVTTVSQILKSNNLSATEPEVANAVRAWGVSELKREGVDISDESVVKVVSDLIPLVRFPTMSSAELSVAADSKLLDLEVVIQLFTYLGQISTLDASLDAEAREEKSKKFRSEGIKRFNFKPRDSRRLFPWFRFSATDKHTGVTLDAKRTSATSSDSQTMSVMGDRELREGEWEWEVEVKAMPNASDTGSANTVVVGVCSSSRPNQIAETIGAVGVDPLAGWSFSLATKTKIHGASTAYSDKAWGKGDVIRVKLNLTARTIEFLVNGKSQGVAFTDVMGPVKPAVTLYGNTQLSLRFPKTARLLPR